MSFTDSLLHTSKLFLLLIEFEPCNEEDGEIESSCGVYAVYSVLKSSNTMIAPSYIKIFNCQHFNSWEEGAVYAEMNGYAVKEDVIEEMNALRERIRPLTARSTMLRANIIERTRDSYVYD